MNQKLIINIVLILLFFFVEVTITKVLFSPAYSLRLIMLIGVSLLFLDRQEESFWWLIGGGILLDLQSSQVFGMHVFTLLGLYLVINLFRQRVVHQPNLFILVATVIISVFVYDLVQWLTIANNGGLFTFGAVFWRSLVVNLIFIWPIYLITYYFAGWLEDKKQTSFKGRINV